MLSSCIQGIGATTPVLVIGVTAVGATVPVVLVVAVGTVVVGATVVPVVVAVGTIVVGATVVPVVVAVGTVVVGNAETVPEVAEVAVMGDTVLGATVVVVAVVAVGPKGTEGGTVVTVGATEVAVIVVVGAILWVITGFETLGELTAVVPIIVAFETFVLGLRVVLTFGGGATATFVGATAVGAVEAEACWFPPALLKKTKARIIPIKARRQRRSHTQQGQGYFWGLSGGGGGAYLILDVLRDPASQLGPLIVSTKG